MSDAHWPKLWADLPLAVFDIETTGFDFNTCEILEIGIVHFEHGQKVKEFNWILDPECEIPKEIQDLTHITPDMVEGQPKFRDIADDVLEAFSGHGLVAYNIGFDRPFITHKLLQLGKAWPDQNPTLDPLVFANYFFPNKKNNLGSVVERLGLSLEGAHRACNDAEATGYVLYKLFEQFEVPPDLESLLIVQAQWERENEQRMSWRKGNGDGAIGLNAVNEVSRDLTKAFVYGRECDPLKALYSAVPNVK